MMRMLMEGCLDELVVLVSIALLFHWLSLCKLVYLCTLVVCLLF